MPDNATSRIPALTGNPSADPAVDAGPDPATVLLLLLFKILNFTQQSVR